MAEVCVCGICGVSLAVGKSCNAERHFPVGSNVCEEKKSWNLHYNAEK